MQTLILLSFGIGFAFETIRRLGKLGKKAESEMTFYGTIQDHGGKEFGVSYFWDQASGADFATLHVANVTMRAYAGEQNFTYELCAEPRDTSEDWKSK